MGLDCSHDAFHGAYSAFNRFRQAVCKCVGGSFPYHKPETLVDGVPALDNSKWYIGDEYSEETHPGLWEFLCHSDCDGEIPSYKCLLVADELEKLLPQLDAMGEGGGHLARDGGYGAVARKFIAGCRLAAEHGEALDFH